VSCLEESQSEGYHYQLFKLHIPRWS